MLKLPKAIQDHPRAAALAAYIAAPRQPLDDGLLAALRAAVGTGHVVQGLEQIEALLDKELKGIEMVRARSGQPASARLSRLIVLSSDGSDRFTRGTKALLTRHADRAHALVVDATAAALGAELTPKGGPAKALMIADKKALALFFSRLATTLETSTP